MIIPLFFAFIRRTVSGSDLKPNIKSQFNFDGLRYGHPASIATHCSMGPWPGIEPGPAGPQPTVLTPTLPQPSSIAATDVFCLKVARLRYVPIHRTKGLKS